MADLGFDLPYGKAARDEVLPLIRKWKPTRRAFSVATFGWSDDELLSYVLRPDRVIGG